MTKLPKEVIDNILLYLDDPDLAIKLKRKQALKMICKNRDSNLLYLVGIGDIPNFKSCESVDYLKAIFCKI